MKQPSVINKSWIGREKAKFIGFGTYSYKGGKFIIRRRRTGESGWEVSKYSGELVTHGKTVKDAVANLEQILM